ncbi:DUF4238 domain-containing protein [Amycolatopsis sp. NPDC051758]|uniref:DUF4238 domain-containing protein n=1 Tax=Amycolatopsis sp. NPDC051758 TaxID=3363935 RepID=UPI0037B15A76
MSGPKRHHFVPRAFLQRFGCDGRVSVRRRGRGRLITARALNVAVESSFYTTQTPEGGKSTEIEALLAEVDGPADKAIAEVIEKDELPAAGTAGREVLATYMAVQVGRTPEAREQVAFPENFLKYADGRRVDAKLMAEYLREVHLGFEPSDGEVAGAIKMVEAAEVMGTLSHNDTVTVPLSVAEKYAGVLMRKHWSLEVARKPRFLTSDAPLVAWHKPTPADRYRGRGFGNAAEVRFPISSGHQLVLTDQPRPLVIRVEPARVRQCNADVAAGCHNFIVGHPNHPRQLHEVSLAEKRPTLRFSTFPGYRVDADGTEKDLGEVPLLWVQRAVYPTQSRSGSPRRQRHAAGGRRGRR